MALPMLRKCCWCFSLEKGDYIVCLTSTLACVANIIVGSWSLSRQSTREPEDNLISMSMVMFSTLAAIANIVALAGIYLRRPGYLQLSMLFTSVFIVCLFLVAILMCVFSPEFTPHLQTPANISFVVIGLCLGAFCALYYLTIVNSLYRKMKMNYTETYIPDIY